MLGYIISFVVFIARTGFFCFHVFAVDISPTTVSTLIELTIKMIGNGACFWLPGLPAPPYPPLGRSFASFG